MHPGKLVKRWRTERDLSLEELSTKAGMDKMALSKIERGISDPHVSTLQKIATALDVPATYLLSETDEWPNLSIVVGSIEPSKESADAAAKIHATRLRFVRLQATLFQASTDVGEALAELDALADSVAKRG